MVASFSNLEISLRALLIQQQLTYSCSSLLCLDINHPFTVHHDFSKKELGSQGILRKNFLIKDLRGETQSIESSFGMCTFMYMQIKQNKITVIRGLVLSSTLTNMYHSLSAYCYDIGNYKYLKDVLDNSKFRIWKQKNFISSQQFYQLLKSMYVMNKQ